MGAWMASVQMTNEAGDSDESIERSAFTHSLLFLHSSGMSVSYTGGEICAKTTPSHIQSLLSKSSATCEYEQHTTVFFFSCISF